MARVANGSWSCALLNRFKESMYLFAWLHHFFSQTLSIQHIFEFRTYSYYTNPTDINSFKLPTTLRSPSQATQNSILIPPVDAHLNGHLGTAVLDYATTLFGATLTERAVAEGKADRKEAMPANGAGVMMVCRSIMRAYVSLRKQGEEGNAAELRRIAGEYYSKETVDREMAEVVMVR